MDGQNCLRALGDRGFDAVGIDVERLRIDVDEDRLRADQSNRLSRGNERERRGNHFVARADAERTQDQMQRIGAIADADRVIAAEELRDFLLKRLHVRSQNVLPTGEHRRDGRVDLALELSDTAG